MSCSKCGAPVRENGKYSPDIGMVCGFEAGQQHAELLEEAVYSLLLDDERYRELPNLWRHNMKKRIKQLRYFFDAVDFAAESRKNSTEEPVERD